MSLTEAPIDKVLKVVFIESCEETKRKLSAMGVQLDNEIIKINDSKWGPVLIQNSQFGASKLAIGRGIAQRIKVSYE